MEIYVCVRKTLDWSDEAHVEAYLKPSFRQKYQQWNATFEMPYAAFRARLKAIAERNLDRVEGAKRAFPEEVSGGDGLVVPVDDDDWLAPDLAVTLRRALARDPARATRVGVNWIRESIQPPRRHRRLRRWLRPGRRRGRHTCATNNYALRGDLPDAPSLVRSHLGASAFFDERPDRVLWIPRVLAIQNRNLASQTTLRRRHPTITREQLLARFEAYRRFYSGWTIRRELRWAQPCIDAMAELMDALRVR